MATPTFFVTGTDTGVGKTLVTAGLLRALLNSKTPAAGMKPIASGSLPLGFHEGQREELWEDILTLDIADRHALSLTERSLYRFSQPLAPHFAALQNGVTISPEQLINHIGLQQQRSKILVVEGVGGLRVPLNHAGYDLRELISDLSVPVVLVVGLRLGCLNHALLTVEALRSKNIEISAWVANAGIDPHYANAPETIRSLEVLTGLPCAATLLPIGAAKDDDQLRLVPNAKLNFNDYLEAIEYRVASAAKMMSPLALKLSTLRCST